MQANNLITDVGAKFLAINKKHIAMLNISKMESIIDCYTISDALIKYIQTLRESVNTQ
jgi:hypothetical protein